MHLENGNQPTVLMVNWSWYPSGGDWTYVTNVQRLYQANGYRVIGLSTKNEKNVDTGVLTYFVNSPDYKQLNRSKGIKSGFKAVKNSIVNYDALRTLDDILNSHSIEVAHLHNIHHYITPAIIWKLKKAGVRILWSLHDYKIICPENSFVSNNVICEKCITGHFYHCATNLCKKKSLAASSLAAFEAYFYHKSRIYDKVDAFLCPSEFLRSKFLQFGFPAQKLHVTNLCYDLSLIDRFLERNKTESKPLLHTNNEQYILYVGRIEEIKGIFTLVKAVEQLDLTLVIAGGGAAQEKLEKMIASENITNVKFIGFQNKESIFQLTKNARFTVCPSEWYENYPFSVIESFLLGTPVIGANIGGIPEMVINDKTGYLFEPGNITDLREKLLQLWNDEPNSIMLGRNAKEYISEIVNFDNHWNTMKSILNHPIKNEQ